MRKIDIELVPASRRSAAKPRSSMMLQAECRAVDGSESTIRVRNLSSTGLGGEVIKGMCPLAGQKVRMNIRAVPLSGQVIWINGTKLGIAFDGNVDVASFASGWNGPGFEVAALHANVGNDHRRPALKTRE